MNLQTVLNYHKNTGKIPISDDVKNCGSFLSTQKGSYKNLKNKKNTHKMSLSRVPKFEEACKELGIDLENFCLGIKTKGKQYKCECGCIITDSIKTIKRHNTTKKHTDYISKNKK